MQSIAEQYATIITEYKDGSITATSFYHGTSAVKTMLDLAPHGYSVVKAEGLYATDQFHAGYVKESDGRSDWS